MAGTRKIGKSGFASVFPKILQVWERLAENTENLGGCECTMMLKKSGEGEHIAQQYQTQGR